MKTKNVSTSQELLAVADGIFKSLSKEVYVGDAYRAKFFGDVNENNKWFVETSGDKNRIHRSSLFTFKSCIQDDSNEYPGFEQVGKVWFYDRLDSNCISINTQPLGANTIYIRLHIHTLDDSSLRFWWLFNSVSQIDQMEALIRGLYNLVDETKVFWQSEFMDRLKNSDIEMPFSADSE